MSFFRSGMVRTELCIVLAACASALTSCSKDSRAIDACEAALLPMLKAPASYRRVSDMVAPPQSGRQSVVITYDAVNSYNAPLRDTFVCALNPSTGATTNAADTQDQYADDLSVANETAAPAASKVEPLVEANPPPTPSRNLIKQDGDPTTEVPVCDRPDSPEKSALMNEIGTDCMGE